MSQYFIISLSRRGNKTISDDPFLLNSFDMFDMVWTCLNMFGYLFGVFPRVVHRFAVGHLSRSCEALAWLLALRRKSQKKNRRKKGEIETRWGTTWHTNFGSLTTFGMSKPSTHVPTKKRVHREKICTIESNLLIKSNRRGDAASFDLSLGLRLGVADWATLGLPFAQCGKYRPGHPVSVSMLRVNSLSRFTGVVDSVSVSLAVFYSFLILFEYFLILFASNSAVPNLS